MARLRAKTAARGYSGEHAKLRERWRPAVDAGQAYCQQPRCVMPTRWIPPGTPWDLGHNDSRTGWIGPCHAKCNRAAGNRSPRRRQRATGWLTSRNW